MSKHLVEAFIGFSLCTAAAAEPWQLIGDKRHPNCAQNSCLVSEGDTTFGIGMQTEVVDNLTYLRRLTIKNRDNGKVQEFSTGSVSAAEHKEPFQLYSIHLQAPDVVDLALAAFDSAKAGPTFYYYLYDKARKTFVESESTTPKLIYDSKAKTWKTELQGIPHQIVNHQVKEK